MSTDLDLSQLKPGRELDALIARKIMGWHEEDIFDPRDGHPNCPHYSTDIAAAQEILNFLENEFEKFCLQRWTAEGVEQDGGSWFFYEAEHTDGMEYAQGFTLPHVLCLAALKAVEQK